MKKKILIIGKKSFIGTNLFIFLKRNKINSRLVSYKYLINNTAILKEYNYIINCTYNKLLVKKRYNSKFDNDFIIVKKIKKFNSKFIFLSTRKIYKPKFNINENATKQPLCNYSKNKLITEKKNKKNFKK